MLERQFLTEALRVGRLVRGLSLHTVAAATGVPGWRLRALERGVSPIRPAEFLRVWEFLAGRHRDAE